MRRSTRRSGRPQGKTKVTLHALCLIVFYARDRIIKIRQVKLGNIIILRMKMKQRIFLETIL